MFKMLKIFKFFRMFKMLISVKIAILRLTAASNAVLWKHLWVPKWSCSKNLWPIVPKTKTLRVRTSPGTKSSTLNSLAMRTSLQLLATSSVRDWHFHINHHFDKVFVFCFVAIVIVTKVILCFSRPTTWDIKLLFLVYPSLAPRTLTVGLRLLNKPQQPHRLLLSALVPL